MEDEVYSDSDWAGDKDDRRSVTGLLRALPSRHLSFLEIEVTKIDLSVQHRS